MKVNVRGDGLKKYHVHQFFDRDRKRLPIEYELQFTSEDLREIGLSIYTSGA